MMSEIGAEVKIVATPDRSTELEARALTIGAVYHGEVDYDVVEGLVADGGVDMVIGSSKAYPAARRKGVSLVRIGFPIHDRVGGARLLHLGYRGSHQLLDRVVNTVLERRQAESAVGYAYQ